MLRWVFVLCVACLSVAWRAEGAEGGAGAAEGGKLLQTLRAGHPRLFLTPDSLAELRQGVQSDPARAAIYKSLRGSADWIVAKGPVVKYEIIGPRLLSQSRLCFDHVTTCGLVYLLSGEKKYADRAIQEMLTAAEFKDWNPSHFLDVAEMTAGMAIGYDWLFDRLTPEQRAKIRTAILTHGLTPGENSYKGKAGYGWWHRVNHNWSQVCNGGLTLGALAIADEEPARAEFILESARQSIDLPLHSFSRDGAWAEGPGYWNYATMYTAYYMAALQSALGTMLGTEKNPALANAGFFRIYSTGPTGKSFNFADAHEPIGRAPQMFFFARLFHEPAYAAFERTLRLNGVFDLLWYDSAACDLARLPLDKHFRGSDVAFLRSAWRPDALWVGLKGGDNAANHSHLDLGSFVFDALGQRWASDLGSDYYNLPGYFGGQRWTYYRLKNEGHNTLMIDGQNQPPKAKAPIIAFDAAAAGPSCVVDLSAAYPMAQQVRRGWALPGRQQMLIQDEITADHPVEVVWSMHTAATITLAGPTKATLKLGGQTLTVQALEPADAAFKIESATPPAPQDPNKGITRLTLRLPEKVRTTRLAVLFTPLSPSAPASASAPSIPSLTPLAKWPGRLDGKK